MKIKNLLTCLCLSSMALVNVCCVGGNFGGQNGMPDEVTIHKARLLDKIKGGWAGQTIGCTYGGPTEFRYQGKMIPDSVELTWKPGCIKWWYDNTPGIYDDIYMDLTFVDVFERLGLDAPADSFAMAFAHAGYPLWHANQAARYNILNGIMPPESGHWLNNPHADCIDYQIEADFAGLMSPGMPNSASEISDKIGHIMNYGDGWYGGVYVGAMYSLAFVSDSVEFVVEEALKTIPAESRFYQCMQDVIRMHKENPDDWKKAWTECEEKWSNDVGCPEGVLRPFNIDAVINSAYILIGLLYGDGDFHRTMDIATRCGQDSDCNPASAAGILGTIIGYNRIPKRWMSNLKDVEHINFAYTDISLDKVYQMSYRQALEMIEHNGGKIVGEQITISCQQPEPVKMEKSFENVIPSGHIALNKTLTEIEEVTFEGSGVVFRGQVKSDDADYVAKVDMLIDGELVESVKLPASFKTRRYDLFWKYQLPMGQHTVTFQWLNPKKGSSVNISEAVVFVDETEKASK